jgi:hypothetical protein
MSGRGGNDGDEIYAVRDTIHYNIPASDRDDACAAFGGRVASLAELTRAQQSDGAQWCACSFVSDNGAQSYYPMQSGGSGGCGGPVAGVRTCSGGFRDVACIKEAVPQYQIFSTQWEMSDNAHLGKKIFAVRDNLHYSIKKEDAQAACSAYGARMCTNGEMTSAQQKDGAQWCACSFVSDSSSTHYPMQSGGSSGCGGSAPGVRSCGTQGGISDVCCIKDEGPNYQKFTQMFTLDNGNKMFAVRDRSHYKIPENEENAACGAFGARVGTLAELNAAQQNNGA